jgi:hypothetical protein
MYTYKTGLSGRTYDDLQKGKTDSYTRNVGSREALHYLILISTMPMISFLLDDSSNLIPVFFSATVILSCFQWLFLR